MLKMPMIFGDRMVLQREKRIAVWGETEGGAKVTAVLDGNEVSSVADPEGKFIIYLPEMPVKRGLTLTVKTAAESVTYNDVKTGDVFIAGGQSNMEYLLGTDADKDFEINADKFPEVSFFGYPEYSYEGMEEEFPDESRGFWRIADAENIPFFSAVAYYFAKRVNEALNVPIGIVGCNWGGSPVSAWMAKEDVTGELDVLWKQYREETAGVDLKEVIGRKKALIKTTYEATHTYGKVNADSLMQANGVNELLYPGFSREKQLEMLAEWSVKIPLNPIHEWRPCGLYETMLKKITPYSAKAVIWYQGESDCNPDRGPIYNKSFGKMIRRWRLDWNDDLPFFFVQIAPFGHWMDCEGKDYHYVREAQDKLTKEMKDTYMVSIGDSGMMWDIHPKHKRPVGERMAELAIGHMYNMPDKCKTPGLCDAPEFSEIQRLGKNEIRIKLLYADGLHVEKHAYPCIDPISREEDEAARKPVNDPINGFDVPGLKSVSIENDELVLFGDFSENTPVAFAQGDYYEVNVYNKAGIPLKPFMVK